MTRAESLALTVTHAKVALRSVPRSWLVLSAMLLVVTLVAIGSGQRVAIAEIPVVALEDLTPNAKHIRTAKLIQYHINRLHYRNRALDDELSKEMLRGFVENLDGNRSYFTELDIRRFNHYSDKLDDDIKQGRLVAPFEIFRTYRIRVEDRIAYAIRLLERDFDYSIDEEYQFDRSEAAWATDAAELDEIWRKRVKNDLLSLKLAGGATTPKDTLRKRYERILRRSEQLTSDDVFAVFINAYATAIEPHTRYFPPRDSENFRIRMSLSLQGIGAVLQSENEHTVVRRVVPGGPADIGGELKAGDSIVGVGQEKGDVVDVVGWRLDDVVDLIRGPKNTVVSLRIQSKGAGPEAKPKDIDITRDTIKLEEQAAHKRIIEIGEGDDIRKVGVIDLDTFYIDFDARANGDKNYRSTTRDVKKLLGELVDEGIDGLVVDLRGNGGGSLAEATALTGLFIASGPIVQVQDSSANLQVNEDPDPKLVYGGPLAVLVNRDSASASEIFAGAIQDYQRGLVIGEPTYGKGTVQNLLDLNRHSRNNEQLGQLKVTIAQFFRIDGDSTQHRGVVPDIELPTAINMDEYGERSRPNALPWSKVEPARYVPSPLVADEKALERLRKHHSERVVEDPGYAYLLADIDAQTKAINTTTVSLLESKRREEQESTDKSLLARINSYRQSIGLSAIESTEDADEGLEDGLEDKLADVSLVESAHILTDYINLEGKTFAFGMGGKKDTSDN